MNSKYLETKYTYLFQIDWKRKFDTLPKYFLKHKYVQVENAGLERRYAVWPLEFGGLKETTKSENQCTKCCMSPQDDTFVNFF